MNIQTALIPAVEMRQNLNPSIATLDANISPTILRNLCPGQT
jgi:hypothetical protein